MAGVAPLGDVCAAMPAHKADVLKAITTVTCHWDPTLTTGEAANQKGAFARSPC